MGCCGTSHIVRRLILRGVATWLEVLPAKSNVKSDKKAAESSHGGG